MEVHQGILTKIYREDRDGNPLVTRKDGRPYVRIAVDDGTEIATFGIFNDAQIKFCISREGQEVAVEYEDDGNYRNAKRVTGPRPTGPVPPIPTEQPGPIHTPIPWPSPAEPKHGPSPKAQEAMEKRFPEDPPPTANPREASIEAQAIIKGHQSPNSLTNRREATLDFQWVQDMKAGNFGKHLNLEAGRVLAAWWTAITASLKDAGIEGNADIHMWLKENFSIDGEFNSKDLTETQRIEALQMAHLAALDAGAGLPKAKPKGRREAATEG